MHEKKSFNRNPANNRLYHALIEALIEDENAMDKRVADIVKDHKRKYDDDDDDNDDDDDPPIGPNQGRKTKRRRTEESESLKKPSFTKETLKARPPTPDLEWNKRQFVLGQPKQPWFNQMVSATKDPLTFNDLMATPIDFSKYVLNQLKIDNLTQDILLGPAYDLLKKEIITPFDLSKPLPLQGHPGHLNVAANYFFHNDLEYLKSSDLKIMYTKSITKIKQLEEIVVKKADRQLYKFKEGDFVYLHLNDIEDILLLADLQLSVESYQKKLNITPPQQTFLKIEFKELYTPSHKPPGLIYKDLTKQKSMMRADELYKFSNETLKKVQDELHHRVLDFHLG
uniref:Uncharacterized protein n=1 Tax=Tanacetum cinerariifolium TaxID=118510 RepID=A0A699KKD0_TANCI|nr:hypothetical protein [Tanacetum cinerariifolium]